MPGYRQNEEQVWPRNGTAPTKDFYPLSRPVYDAAMLAPSEENPAGVAPGGGYRAVPLLAIVAGGNFGRHDGLDGRLMEVAQADTFDARGSARWPAAGTWEEPNGPVAALRMVRLKPTTSAHPGAGIGLGGGPGPTMVYAPPPSFTVQTRPIFATGL